jgi:hypothetical protein
MWIKYSVLPTILIIMALFLMPNFTPNSDDTTTISYYYLWYNSDSDWTEKTSQTPQLQHYTSTDIDTIHKHIEWAMYANIDCFALSYWGKHDARSVGCCSVIQKLEEEGFKYCIMIETDSEDFVDFELLSDELDYIIDNYVGNDHYFKVNDKPILIIFENPSDAYNWGLVKESYPMFSYWLVLKMSVEDHVFSSLGNLTETFDLVDVYSPLVYSVGMKYVGVYNESAVVSGLQAYFAQKLFWNQQTKYTSISVQLLYDNTVYAETVKDRTALKIPFYNETVNTYKEVVRKDYVLFCSFNEWYETTSCEPSVEEDYKYLDLLRNLLP